MDQQPASVFGHNRDVAIHGGHYVLNQDRYMVKVSHDGAFEKLQKATASNAFHNSSARFDAPKCHPNTREAILKHITEWIYPGKGDRDSLILWLYGPAGSGKSTIAQSIAEQLSRESPSTLLGSFFFSKADPSRDGSSNCLVATIAYQMAIALPKTRKYIEGVIDQDPLIFDKSLSAQLHAFIIQPLLNLVSAGTLDCEAGSHVIIIDGLDECKDPRFQQDIVYSLRDALRDHHLPLRVLITSRPEQHISFLFNSSSMDTLRTSLVLDNRYKPNEDIRKFFVDKFNEIKTAHPRKSAIPANWPEGDIVDTLVKKSSGQFIYASCVVRYVSAVHERPLRRLKIVMELTPDMPDMPFAELDALYMHLLESTNPDGLHQILALVVLRKGRDLAKVGDIERFLGLEDGEVDVALSPLLAVIALYPEINITHASFVDFLLDKTRSRIFHVDPLVYNHNFAIMCIDHIMDTIHSLSKLPLAPSVVKNLEYSFKHLKRHLTDCEMTEELSQKLESLSLPDIWTKYSLTAEESSEYLTNIRKNFIPNFLSFLKPKRPQDEVFDRLYQLHVNSMNQILQAELSKYHAHPALLTTLVIVCLTKVSQKEWFFRRNEDVRTLTGMDAEAERIDANAFRLYRSKSLWDGYLASFSYNPLRAHTLYLYGEKYAQAALQILRYLCRTRRHPRREFRGPADPAKHVYRRINVGRARQRRVEKHQRGSLCLSRQHADYKPCLAGLKILPELLQRASYSKDLLQHIRRRQRKIAIVAIWTRRALESISAYQRKVTTAS